MRTPSPEYLAEYERVKHIVITPGPHQWHKPGKGPNYEVLEVNNERVILRNEKTSFVSTRTLHWCRKHLTPITSTS